MPSSVSVALLLVLVLVVFVVVVVVVPAEREVVDLGSRRSLTVQVQVPNLVSSGMCMCM